MSAKLFNLPIKLSLEMIAKLFSATQIQKAQNYLIQGRVLEVTASSNNHDIEAYVEGSADEPYRQEITLVNVNHKIVMRSHCTCPVRSNCKHVAAAMLALVDKKPVEEQRIYQWLRQLDEQKAVNEYDDEQDEKDRIIYVLSNDPNGIFVEFKRSKLNKKGQYNKGSKLALTDIRYSMPWWIAPEDKQIISLLLSSNNHGSKIYIDGEISYLALTKMLAEQVCFWEENRTPLTWAKSIAPEFVWCELDKKHTQMQMRMPGLENWEFIATEPPLYVELDYLRLGKINTDLSAKKLSLLQHMPPVPLTQVDQISHKMLQHFSPKTVPVPSEIDFCEINDPLKTKLIFTREIYANNPILQPVIRVEQHYGAVSFNASLKPERISLVKKGHVQYQVHRSVEQELAILQALTEAGLVSFIPSEYANQPEYYLSVGLLPESIFEWSDLTENGLEALTALGVDIEFEDDFDLKIVDAQLDVDLVDDDESGWFSLSLSADIEGQNVPLLALVARWLQQNGEPADEDELILPGPNGGFIKIKAKTIKPLISIIQELFNRHSGEQLTIPRNRAHILNDLSASDVRLLNGERVRNLAAKLAEFKGVTAVDLPAGLNASLRDYQKQGFDWLCFLKEYQLGGILADDMGLGKTIQTLAFLLKAKQEATQHRTSLIVCPTSLVGNWQSECAKFTPQLEVLALMGQNRAPLHKKIMQSDVVLTSYGTLSRDLDKLRQYDFHLLILDEAQAIKNSKTRISQTVKMVPSKHRLCLTGTPIENHLGELWSMFEFLMPGFLGSKKQFQNVYQFPIEKTGDVMKQQALQARVAPLMMRRKKEQVATELPDKTEVVELIELEEMQAAVYESVRLSMADEIRQAVHNKSGHSLLIGNALLRLRQVCCHPSLIGLGQNHAETQENQAGSGKLAWLRTVLPTLIEDGRRILIFSSFTSMLQIIADELSEMGLDFLKLTGKTPAAKRSGMVEEFQQGDVPVFLISLKAGGAGLNLTAADTVIHFDPWWNPAAEKQASDRAHRIGQDKQVFVYKLIARGTVEQKINDMQNNKKLLADSVLNHNKTMTDILGEQQWESVFEPLGG